MSSDLEEAPRTDKGEDDGSWIDEEFLKYILDPKATILKINVERATSKGDNYLSVIHRVKAEYKLQGSDEIYVKSFIIKVHPQNELVVKFLEELNVFKREISIYKDVLPSLYGFADNKFGKDSFKRFSAACYEIDRTDILILEDLKSQGFVMASRKDRLDFSHAKLVTQTLARLHAVSIAYTEKNPSLLAPFEDFMFCENGRETLDQYIIPILKGITEEVRRWEGFDEIADKLERLQQTIVDRIIKIANFNGFQRAFLHADTWVNNVLFKYTERGEPVDVRLVDFQASETKSPALDLQYFLFASVRNEILFLHYDDFLLEYYNELKRTARNLRYGGKLFTLEGLKREMKRTSLFGFYSAISILPPLLADPKDVHDVETMTVSEDEVQFFGNSVYESPEFRRCFEQLLLHFDKQGVLDEITL